MKALINTRYFVTLVIVVILGGCAFVANSRLDGMFGPVVPQQRMAAAGSERGDIYHQRVKPLIENRCVVCHGCYDAPCQLKLSSAQGIDRGASKTTVYDGTRLRAAPTSRLYIDYDSTAQWRENGFYPVLNDRNQDAMTNQQASVMSRLLALKQQHPLPEGGALADHFDFSLDREQQCPKLSELDSFEQKFPYWGMPFGLPALNQAEDQVLQDWLRDGAKMAPLQALGADYSDQVALWETFLNGDSVKQQLAARYLYEHWFIAHLYFSELPPGEFFRIVRSRTPPGQAIDIIATRRPYDDPGVERVYYRLWRERGTLLEKTHMPYALNSARLDKYTKLFMQAEYEVESLPSYRPHIASNPFKAFEAIPTVVRYKFLLEEAQFTIMNFIKGPVCRGQVALNVINDHFWVFFVKPAVKNYQQDSAFYSEEQDKLALPSEAESNAYILTNWLKYSSLQNEYMLNKAGRMNEAFPNGEHLTTNGIWDGDGDNSNAALTVFRHFDSATVLKGLVGRPPQTAWVVDYGLLERIHYLLAAGFDVYGNLGHQFNTRLYMDFLRIEGEFNFLSLLPPESRTAELQHWYQGVSQAQRDNLLAPHKLFTQPSGVVYKTDHPKQELFQLLQQKLAPVLANEHSLENSDVPVAHREILDKLHGIKGGAVTLMPQVTFLTVQSNDATRQYTVLRNNAHSNITSLLNENENRLPQNDTITVVNGLVSAYPEAFINVNETQLDDYVTDFLAMRHPDDYKKLLDKFGIRRTDSEFWPHSDAVHAWHKKHSPYRAGLFDYNRLESR